MLQPTWPPLAWLARCRKGSGVVQLVHGRRVEVTPEWFGEVVWAGPYSAGDFDQTDIVFGSGGRVRGSSITFVSSASPLDRLHSLDTADGVWVSNSLLCLLVTTGATLDPTYPAYAEDLSSILDGLSRYKRTMETSAGAVRLTYFENLEWTDGQLRTLPKIQPLRDFSSFARYRGFLDSSLAAIAENMSHAGRKVPYRFLGTLSTGYDSPAIATLALPHGLTDVLTFTTARSGDPDSGREIAGMLGLRVSEISRNAWRDGSFPEAPFLAADGKGEEVFLAGAHDALEGRVLLTGFHGDRVWDMRRPPLPDLARRSLSGVSLAEYRLIAGCVNLAVPYLGARQFDDIHALSVSPALAPWRTGRRYSRPICRRIVEEAGVPRHAFGQRKKAASVLLYGPERGFTEASLRDYLAWLESQAPAWRARGLPTPDRVVGRRTMAQRLCNAAAATIQAAGGRAIIAERIGDRLAYFGCQDPVFRYLFPWAVERASKAYR